MPKYNFILFMLSLLLISCATVSGMRKTEQFEQVSRTYEHAIRWSDFATASSFLKTQKTENFSARLEELQKFRVTSYTIRKFLPSEDKSRVLLIAEIKYFRINGLIVKSISDRQLWEYDITEERWFLTSGLPDFK